jgi:hypothetical protein
MLALVVASSSAAAQIVQWRRSGPRVKVSSAYGVPVGGIEEVAPEILAIVKAANGGRLATTVNGWASRSRATGAPR